MNPENTKKNSPIHENADANITCDFGDGDISCLGVANQTHVYKHRSLALLLLLWFKAGAPRTEHYQLVRTLSADAVVTVL